MKLSSCYEECKKVLAELISIAPSTSESTEITKTIPIDSSYSIVIIGDYFWSEPSVCQGGIDKVEMYLCRDHDEWLDGYICSPDNGSEIDRDLRYLLDMADEMLYKEGQ